MPLADVRPQDVLARLPDGPLPGNARDLLGRPVERCNPPFLIHREDAFSDGVQDWVVADIEYAKSLTGSLYYHVA